MAETGNSIREKESDVGKEVEYGRASGEQIPNRHDDDQSVDETSQMGNGLGETEAVSDDALAEPMKNRDNKSVDEAAETGNSICENELDVGKEVVFGGASGVQIPNLHHDDQSVHETSQMGNGVEETEEVSDGALREPIKNRDHNKSVYEIAKTGNSIGEKESDVGKEVVYGGASGEQIPNPHDYDQSVDETSQMGNVLCETEAVSDGALAEPMKNRDNKSVDEAAEPGNNSDAEKESDSVKQVIFLVGHQLNKSQICMMMTKVLMKPHKWEMVFLKQKGCPMAHLLNQSKIVMIKTVLMKRQKKEIIVVLKKSQML